MQTYVKPVVETLTRAVENSTMTHRELERASSVNRATIREILRGRATSIDKARKMSSALGVPVESCFTYTDGTALGVKR